MKLKRSENAIRNIIFGIINKVIVIILPFVTRVIIIHILGADYLGLGSLFSSILQVLSLTELGFGSAMVYSMYKPIAENDNQTLCALLALYKKIYFIIGIVICGIGLCILPFLKYLINGEYPSDINLYYLYLIYLVNTVYSYFFWGYKSSLLEAYQRVDISNNINSVVNIIMYLLQIFILVFTRNYYFYVLVLIGATIAINFFVSYFTSKLFPNIKCEGNLSKKNKEEIKVKVEGLMLNKLCQVSRNAFDSIFVSMFLGLVQTAIYNNYYYIMNAVTSILSIVSPSILGGVGNSIVTETVEKNYSDMTKINFIYMWISGWCTVCLFCLYQPFTKIFFGKSLLLPINAVILFCAYFYVLKMGDIRSVYVHANGLWWENRYRSVIEALANLILNYFLGKQFGIYGIIGATLISLFVINFAWGSGIVFKYYFKGISPKEYYFLHFYYAIVTILGCAITYRVCEIIGEGNIFKLLFRLIMCMMIPNILYLILYKPLKIYKTSIEWILHVLKIKNQYIYRLFGLKIS